MASTLLSRKVSAAIGGAAIFAMIGFTAACSSDSDKPAEETTTTTTTTTPEPTVAPTEKPVNPGVTVFTPPPTAPQFDPNYHD